MKAKRAVGIFFTVAIMAMWVARASAGPGQHTVTVTLNYDFSVDNACSTTVTTGCIKQFNIYDITGGAAPASANPPPTQSA